MRKIFSGVLYVVGGLAVYLVLRETHIGVALASVGGFLIIWGVLERIAHSEHADLESGQNELHESTPSPQMNESEAELWIMRELGRLRMPDDLIAPVCEMTGLTWDEAKRLIRSVQDSDTVGQRRIALTFGCPIIAIGVCLLVATTFSLVYNIAATRNAGMVHPLIYCGFFAGLLMTGAGLYGVSRATS